LPHKTYAQQYQKLLSMRLPSFPSFTYFYLLTPYSFCEGAQTFGLDTSSKCNSTGPRRDGEAR